MIPFTVATVQYAAATTTSQRSVTHGILLLIVASVLLGIAWLNFLSRHSQSVPKIFGKIQCMGPCAVVLLSAVVTIANPKNLFVLLGACSISGQQLLSTIQLSLTLSLFTLIANSPFLLMVGYLAFGVTDAAQSLELWRLWLLRNNHLIMAVVLSVLGIVLAAQ